ncbi:MAG: hypothetical protein A2047_04765 [Omnitrophica bacterium GWA2_41_15]|nr:MAG: hypothetical protein A2047_04765 [Omnitrophica bacterium GWA2_41_15]HAZ10019.1 hypothetical protein [Candidatus Omnitrophota bacterium]
MIKFKKGLITKIISFLIAVLFFFNSSVYGIDIPRNTTPKLRAPVGLSGTYSRLQKALASEDATFSSQEKLFKEVMGAEFQDIRNFYVDDRTGRFVFQKELRSKKGAWITYYYENSVPIDINGKIDDLVVFYNEVLETDEKDAEIRRLIFKALAKYREDALYLKPWLDKCLVLEKSAKVQEEIQFALNLISGKNMDGGKRLNIVFAGYELGFLAGRGGIKDVLEQLPRTFRNKRGHNAIVYIPFWQGIIIEAIDNYNKRPEVKKSGQYIRITEYGSDFIVEGYKVSRYTVQVFNLVTEKYEPIDGVPVYLLKCDEFFSDIKNGDIYRQKKDKNMPGGLDLIDPENAKTSIFFSKAFLEAMKQNGIAPDIINTADWQTALAISFLRKSKNKAKYTFFNNTKIVHTVHNMGPKGIAMAPFAREGSESKRMWDLLTERIGLKRAQKMWEKSEELWGLMDLDDDAYQPPDNFGLEYWGRIALQKVGMVFADQVVTVGRSYADELKTPEFGSGFEGITSTIGVLGIPNGVSLRTIDAATTPSIRQRFANHPTEKDIKLGVVNTQDGKSENKKALVELINKVRRKSIAPDFIADSNTPVFCFVSRFDEQKGLYILLSVLENSREMKDLLGKGMKFVFAGSGALYETRIKKLVEKYPHSIAYLGWVNEPTMKQIFAGADVHVMPSIFEPKGISQMQAARFGAINLVNSVGGLRDDISSFSQEGEGNGYVVDFSTISTDLTKSYLGKPENRSKKNGCRELLYKAISDAITDFNDKEKWDRQVNHVLADSEKFGWDFACMQYEVLFNVLINNFDDLFIGHKIDHTIEHEVALREIYDFALSAYIQSIIKVADTSQRAELQKKAQAVKKLYLYLMRYYEKYGLLRANYHNFVHSMEVTKLAVESAAASGFGTQKDAVLELMVAGMIPVNEEHAIDIAEDDTLQRIVEEIGVNLHNVEAIVARTRFPYNSAADTAYENALSHAEEKRRTDIHKLALIMRDSRLLSTYCMLTPERAEIRVQGLANEIKQLEKDVILRTADFLNEFSVPAFNRLPQAVQNKYNPRFDAVREHFNKNRQLRLPSVAVRESA